MIHPIDDDSLTRSIWERIVDSAERFNEPGVFTALHGFEWTSIKDLNNLHRVVRKMLSTRISFRKSLISTHRARQLQHAPVDNQRRSYDLFVGHIDVLQIGFRV